MKFLMEIKICFIHLEVKFHHGVRRLTCIIQQMLNNTGKHATQILCLCVNASIYVHVGTYVSISVRPEDVSAAVPRELSIFFACLSVCVCLLF